MTAAERLVGVTESLLPVIERVLAVTGTMESASDFLGKDAGRLRTLAS